MTGFAKYVTPLPYITRMMVALVTRATQVRADPWMGKIAPVAIRIIPISHLPVAVATTAIMHRLQHSVQQCM